MPTISLGNPTKLLAVVFFFSGCASLIYQVAWQRILSLHYGVGAVSIATIVSVYMFGLGIGALLGGFLAERISRRMTLFMLIQLLTGLSGLGSVRMLDFLGARTEASSHVFSLLWMALLLSAPTLLMGATLPVATKIFNRLVGNFAQTVSLLYFLNTLGAAGGALITAYFLISLLGLDHTVYLAAAVNCALALVILLGRRLPAEPGEKIPVANPPIQTDAMPLGLLYPLIFVAGFLALGYEMVWFRVMEVLVKASPYSFATVLAVYLAGIAGGSYAMGPRLRRSNRVAATRMFFRLQMAVGACVAVIFAGYYHLTGHTGLRLLTERSFACEVHPPASGLISATAGGFHCTLDILLWPALFILPPAVLMGAVFPLISSLALKKPDREGSTIGTVVCCNVAGNVLGGIATTFYLVPWLGTEGVLLLFSTAGLLFGFFAAGPARQSMARLPRFAAVSTLAVTNLLLFPAAGQLYRVMHTAPAGAYQLVLKEGVDAVVATFRQGDRISNFINGLRHGVRPGLLYYYGAVQAASYAPSVEKVLLIGFGAGSSTEAILKLRECRQVTVVEISSTLIENLRRIPEIRAILSDPRVRLIVDDGRRYLRRTRDSYDLILTDPLRATTAYSNNLYSQEFFHLARSRLAPGGVLLVGVYEQVDFIDKVVKATIASAFDQIRAYRFFCLASERPMSENRERTSSLLAAFPADIRSHLAAEVMIELNSGPNAGVEPQEPEPIYLGDQEYIRRSTRGYPVNTDLAPVSEYYLLVPAMTPRN